MKVNSTGPQIALMLVKIRNQALSMIVVVESLEGLGVIYDFAFKNIICTFCQSECTVYSIYNNMINL